MNQLCLKYFSATVKQQEEISVLCQIVCSGRSHVDQCGRDGFYRLIDFQKIVNRQEGVSSQSPDTGGTAGNR